MPEPPNDRSLAGRVVVVTGAGHGIGAAYAQRLCEDGAAVVLADIDGVAAAERAKALSDSGYRAHAEQLDVTDDGALQHLADDTVSRFGTITGLVNNAAVFSVVPMSRSTHEGLTVDEWDHMMRVNVRGTWQASRAVIPVMRRAGYGKIVNVSSGTALKGSTGRLHYVSSKAAVLGLTKTLAREVGGDGIRVNCVAPGSTLSEEDPAPEVLEYRKARLADRALRRVQMPRDLVGPVAFLIGPDSDFVTGQTLVVDGGSFMH